MQFSLDDVRAVAQLLREHNLAEISVESTTDSDQSCRLLLRRAPAPPAGLTTTSYHPTAIPIVHSTDNGTAPHTNAATEVGATLDGALPQPVPLAITATAVGVFREAETPIQAGDAVRARQVLGSVESLKVPNDIAAPMSGKIVEVLVEEGQGVEYGQLLMTLERAES